MNAAYVVYISLPFLQFVVSLLLAGVVLFSDFRDSRNRLFAVFLLSMALWGLIIFGMRDSFPDRAAAFSWEKAALVVIPFSSVFFYHFVVRYMNASQRQWRLVVMYVLAAVSAGLSVAGFAATDMVEKFYGFAPKLGWAFVVVLAASYPPVLLALRDLTQRIRAVVGEEQVRLQILRAGTFASILGGTSDFLPSLGLQFYPMGIIGNLLFALLTTLAVTRYRLMNLRLLLRRGLAYIVVSAVVFGAYGVAYIGALSFARTFTATAATMLGIGAVVLVGLFVRPLVDNVQRFVDRSFFREPADRLEALQVLNRVTRDVSDFAHLAPRLADMTRQAIQSDWVALLLPSRADRRFVVVGDSREDAAPFDVPADGTAATWLARQRTMLRVGDLASDPYLQSMNNEERAALRRSGADAFVPMVVNSTLVGIAAIGPRIVGRPYSKEDFSFLDAATDQMAIAVIASENARLYTAAQREARERTALAELGRIVNSTLDLTEVYHRCAVHVRHLIPCDRLTVTVFDSGAGVLREAYVSPNARKADGERAYDVDHSPIGRALREGNALILDGVTLDAEAPSNQAEASAIRGSTLVVPLQSNGEVLGSLNLESSRRDAFGREDLDLAQRAGAQVANAIANSRLYGQAVQLAQERELRAQLNAEKQELERLNEAKNRFLSMVSHELKTPLTSIIAFTDLLLRRREQTLNDRQVQHLSVIQRNGQRLHLLINDLLDVSRIESGALRLDMVEFEAGDLCVELKQSFEPIVEAKRQIMSVTISEQLLVCADRVRIGQVLSNLLSNASKYSPEGTCIRLSAWSAGDRVHFQVSDEGPGISDDDQARLFTAFFRADNEVTRSVPGTGLGLMIARSIIQMHGGDIHVNSAIGQGTTVGFYIKDRARPAESATTPMQIVA